MCVGIDTTMPDGQIQGDNTIATSSIGKNMGGGAAGRVFVTVYPGESIAGCLKICTCGASADSEMQSYRTIASMYIGGLIFR